MESPTSNASFNYPLTGEVHVDECFIGGEEELKQGRSKGKKKLVIIVALEKLPFNGVGRASAQIIDNASSASFLPFFKAHISKDAEVVMNEWTGYIPLKNDYKKLNS